MLCDNESTTLAPTVAVHKSSEILSQMVRFAVQRSRYEQGVAYVKMWHLVVYVTVVDYELRLPLGANAEKSLGLQSEVMIAMLFVQLRRDGTSDHEVP